MIKRTSVLLLEVTVAVAVVLGLLAAGTVWRLSQRPLSLSFLLPYAKEVLQPADSPVRIDLDDLILTWEGWERALDIRALGVRVHKSDASPVARIGEVSLSLSFRALIQGRIAPTSLELIRPRILLVRGADGEIAMGVGDPAQDSGDAASGTDSGDILTALLAEISGPPRRDSTFRYLNRVSILNAAMRVEDRKLGVAWRARRADVTVRRSADGLRADFDLSVDLGAAPAEVAGDVHYDKSIERAQIELNFARLDTAALAERIEAARDLAALRTVLDGSVKADLAIDGGLWSGSFRVGASAGTIAVPGADSEPISFRRADIQGVVTRNPGQISVERASIDFGGPVVTAKGVATRVGEVAAISASADLRDLPVERLEKYWPPGVGGGARPWVLTNIRDGSVPSGTVSMTARAMLSGEEKGAVEIDSVNGRFAVSGATVDYLNPLPPIRKASANATFSMQRFDFAVHSGEVGDLRIEEGSVNIWDIGAPREMLAVSALVRGPVEDALRILAHPRLKLLSRVGLGVEGAAGRHATRLRVTLPLLDALKAEDVAVSATSNLSGLALADVLNGQGISKGEVSLRLDNRSLSAEGTANFSDAPARFVWTENFETKSALRRRLSAGVTANARLRKAFDVDFPAYLAGPVPSRILLEERRDGLQTVTADVDLQQAEFKVPGFDWTKLPGRPGKGKVVVVLKNGVLSAVPSFSVEAGDFRTSGNLTFRPGGREIEKVRIDGFALGRSSFSATGVYGSDGRLSVSLRGRALDISPFLARADGAAGGEKKPGLQPFTLAASLERLWVGAGEPLTGVDASLVRGKDEWETASLSAKLPRTGKSLSLTMGPSQTGKSLTFYAEDAGDFLAALDVTDSIRGGTIEAKAARGPDWFAPWKGLAEMKRFVLTGAPGLARILTLASLTGILDVMSGNGIAFDYLNLPVEYLDEVVRIKDGKAVGSELGITGSGTVDLGGDTIDLEGTLIPAYTINSLLGKIPVLGPIITGEKGGGIFAASYKVTGPLEKPEVSVNPLSALAPGFLRNLFGGGEPTESSREPPGPPGD